MVDGVVEERLENVEEDEVELVDAGALHAEVDGRGDKELLMEVAEPLNALELLQGV